jgi:hypothetical protein
MSNDKQRVGGESDESTAGASDVGNRLTKLETQRGIVAAIAGTLLLSVLGGALHVMILTTRLDERYAAEHAAIASMHTQIESLNATVGSLGRFDERLTAMGASVARIETDMQRLRESVDQLRSDVLRNQSRHASQGATLDVRMYPRAIVRRSPRRNSL